MKISVIIRTLNEERYLGDLLESIRSQDLNFSIFENYVEIVLVDSGSTDKTIEIAKKFGCLIHHIERQHFSFGGSLNLGCKKSTGDIFVFVSGHCVPVGSLWLRNLCLPLVGGEIQYTYGRQIEGPKTRLSESRIFHKHFSARSEIPQTGIFCNNANAAILASTWTENRFNEDLTGLEDMYLAKEISGQYACIGYVADAIVVHHHSESWAQVRKRFERESLALQEIMPQIHLTKLDVVRYILFSTVSDISWAIQKKVFLRSVIGIFFYRYNQYVGSYKGNKIHRILSKAEKEKYFFPK
jgi:glycosyltransferase involved in cell wall biosynthesis